MIVIMTGGRLYRHRCSTSFLTVATILLAVLLLAVIGAKVMSSGSSPASPREEITVIILRPTEVIAAVTTSRPLPIEVHTTVFGPIQEDPTITTAAAATMSRQTTESLTCRRT
jgi:hypothetical protein